MQSKLKESTREGVAHLPEGIQLGAAGDNDPGLHAFRIIARIFSFSHNKNRSRLMLWSIFLDT